VFTIHATKKLLDRVKAPVVDPVAQPSTALCNWYATAIFWKPQVALFVNEITFLPVFMPLAPSSTLAQRFPEVLREVLMGIEIDFEFIDHEILSMGEASYSKTANRSAVGVMNEMAFHGKFGREDFGPDEFVKLSVDLAGMPIGPLRGGQGFPDRAVMELVEQHRSGVAHVPPSPKPMMSKPPDTDLEKIWRWCATRIPPQYAHEWKIESSVRAKSVTIFDARAPYDDDEQAEWSSQPIAQLRFSGSKLSWSLYWPDRYGRWHRYPYASSGTIDQMLDEMTGDPKGYFGN
jgi:hypothetical protein